jgi:hypothetical protein
VCRGDFLTALGFPYVLYSRAVDAAGKTESKFSAAKGNEARFKVV